MQTDTPEGRAAFVEALIAKRAAEKEAKRAGKKQYRREYYLANPKSAKLKAKAWREENPERKKEVSRAWRAANKDYVLEKDRKYYADNKEERRLYHSGWRAANAEHIRNSHLMKNFGISQAEWGDILASQGFRCAICQTDEPGGRHGTWCTDHCHATGRIRGILCNACNTGLGLLGDTSEALKVATKYLEKHDAEAKPDESQDTSAGDQANKRIQRHPREHEEAIAA
jgi:hypothetical protein